MPNNNDVPDFRYTRRKVQGTVQEELAYLSSTLILHEAQKLGATYREIPETRIFELKYQDHTEHFHAQIPPQTNELGFYVCLDKNVTKALLSQAGIATPFGYRLIRRDDRAYWREVFDALAKPVVVKPTHANQGRGVQMGISTWESYEEAVTKAFSIVSEPTAGVIVEETFVGKEYRVLATRDKILGIIHRIPANVTGDGQHTIAQLIELKNADPRRSDRDEDALLKIPVDDEVRRHLATQQLSLDSIPAQDLQIFLRLNSNISTGGDSIDYTEIAHPSVHELCLKAMQALPGLAFAGIDFMSQDITQPQTPENYRIIEVNSSPGLSIHDIPFVGTPRKAAQEFVFLLFPELR